MVKGAASLVMAFAGVLAACGGLGGPQSDGGGTASPDEAPVGMTGAQPDGRYLSGTATDLVVEYSHDAVVDGASANTDSAVVDAASAKLDVLVVGGIMKPDAQGAAGAPLVPCSGDPSVLVWDAGYVCGTCGNDAYYAVVCRDGFLSCPTSFVTDTGAVVAVPPGLYVVDRSTASGQCAYVASAYAPVFALSDPSGLTTARDPARPLLLREVPGGGPYALAFSTMFANRAQGEAALRSLVTLTDMTTNGPVDYDIGEAVRDTVGLATLALTPALPLTANAWYRVTVYPGETQQLVLCRTMSGKTSTLLTAPESTDFYTGSRPMVADMFVAAKSGGKGYLQFDFSEALVAADLAAYPMAVAAVDGVELAGCPLPYACAGGVSAGPAAIRLDVASVPQLHTAITLRIPHAIHGTGGGTILEGTAGNPSATVNGDFAIYTFEAADVVRTDNNSVDRWYYVGP